MPNKKISPNGFYMFMQELRFQMQQEGNSVPMADMPLYANEKWIQMSNEEKEAYKERGNAFKQTDSFRQYRMVARQRPKKSRDYASETASGTVPPSSRNRVVMPRQQDSDAILSRIDFISKRDSDRRLLGAKLGWRMPNRQDVIEFEFYIAGVQWFYETDNREFPPCELALIKCSAQGGVLEILHYFIPANDIPCEMISTAQKHSMDTHELLFEDKENKLTYAEDMIKTLNEILVMRGDPQSDELPTFCRAEHFHQVRYALDWVRRKADDPRQLFTTNKLVCIEDFVLALSQRFDDVNSTIDEIEEHMATRHFDCTPQTNCAFHEARSNPNCALGEARSSYYLLMEYVAYKMEIQRQPGTHFPPSMDPIPPSQIPDPPTSRIQRRKPKNLVAAPLELQWENRPPSKPTFYDLADAARKKDAEEAELSQRNLDAMIQRQNAVVPSSVQSTELRSDATAMVSSRIESLSIEGSTAASSTSANNQAAVAQWIAQRSTAQSSVITAAENPSISKGDMQLRLPKRLPRSGAFGQFAQANSIGPGPIAQFQCSTGAIPLDTNVRRSPPPPVYPSAPPVMYPSRPDSDIGSIGERYTVGLGRANPFRTANISAVPPGF